MDHKEFLRALIASKRLIFTLSSLALSMVLYVVLQLVVPLPEEKLNVEIEITKGMSAGKTYALLEEKGLLRDRNVLLMIAKLTGTDRKLKAGYYSFSDSGTPLQVFLKLVRGKVIEYTVTVIEGDTIWDVADRLERSGIMERDVFMALNNDRELMDSLDIDAPSLEGYLFPDTYTFPKGYAPHKVVQAMVKRLRSNYTDEMRAQMEKLGFSEREMLAMASIVEKEAAVDFERPIIAAVYHNRLKKKMLLQADPTSIYGIKDFSEGITRYDLKRNTPYNTYVRRGLPPGPIAAPGLKSIVAALYPADVPYLFFVSKNNGEHHFSRTSREHFNAVNYYHSEKRKMRIQSADGSS